MSLRSTAFCTAVTLICLLAIAHPGSSGRFRPDDPLLVDMDQMPIPKPEPVQLSQIYDFLENTFVRRPENSDGPIPPAENVNTLGEVPDSSWFTNRMGKRRMTVEDLVRGPNTDDGPDTSSPWLIAGVKSQGVTPGFTIRDSRQHLYFIKFDPPRNPQLTTSTEVIATKFFHAFGYWVPQNHLVFITRDSLAVAIDEGTCGPSCALAGHDHPRAVYVDAEGKERTLEDGDVDRLLRRSFRWEDGRIPVIASRRLEGQPVGPFKFFGTRTDDANDIFPHENRRELRGLRVFSAWLNHDDSRSINSLDMYLGEPGKGHVRHHLIDFGSCLGSGSIQVQTRRAGNEYIFEAKPILKAALTLGIWDRPWRSVRYPNYPEIGRFEGDFFQPQLWRPEYPNPAFDRMLPEDAFWATRIIARFDDEAVRALVRTGRIDNPQAEEYLIATLIKRRDKILRYYLAQINPLDDFRVRSSPPGAELHFTHLGMQARLADSCSYEFQWFNYDNETGSSSPITESTRSAEPVVPFPPASMSPLDTAGPHYRMVRIRSLQPEHPAWSKAVDVFVRIDPSPTVVGIDRES